MADGVSVSHADSFDRGAGEVRGSVMTSTKVLSAALVVLTVLWVLVFDGLHKRLMVLDRLVSEAQQ